MKKLKINLALFAALLAVGAATVTKANVKKTTSTQYGRTSTGWVLINDDEFQCDLASDEICKAYFLNDPNGSNPQMDTSAPVVRDGEYVPID